MLTLAGGVACALHALACECVCGRTGVPSNREYQSVSLVGANARGTNVSVLACLQWIWLGQIQHACYFKKSRQRLGLATDSCRKSNGARQAR